MKGNGITWPEEIRFQITRTFLLVIAIFIITGGNYAWYVHSLDKVQDQANNYYLASSLEYLKSQQILSSLVNSLESNKPDGSRENHNTLYYHALQKIQKSLMLQATYDDKRFTSLTNKLKREIAVLNEIISSKLLNESTTGKLIASSKQISKTLTQLGELHIVMRDQLLVTSKQQTSQKQLAFLVLITLLALSGFMYLRRSFKTIHTITVEHFELEREIRKKNREMTISATMFENTMEGIVITDADANIIDANNAITQITGYTKDELLGIKPSIWKSERHDSSFYENMWSSIVSTDHWRGEIWNRHKSGDVFPCWQNITAIKDEEGKTINYVSMLSDITSVKESQEAIEYMAHHDALTDLPNRFLFDLRLEHAMERSNRNGKLIGVLFMDLDGFKHINDSLGHPVGDKVLQLTAKRLKSQTRQQDTIARLGGDEFVLILEDLSSPEEAGIVANKILSGFQEVFLVENHVLRSTTSIGISIFPDDGTTVTTLVKNADMAMYKAKQDGRNSYQFYHREFTKLSDIRIQLEASLHNAFENKEFLLHYQPQYSLKSGQLVGVEALLRWRHPAMGMIPPNKFIPLAEETGLIIPLGEWVLHTACTQMKEWKSMGLDLKKMSINVAGQQLLRNDFFDTVSRICTQTGCSPEWLELEITEGFMMGKEEQSVQLLEKIRDYGIELAIDDFGTGYSSLSYLKYLPFTKLKIDRSFIRDIPIDTNDIAITRSIIALAQSLQLTVIAEGMETIEQEAFLMAEGCDEVQGYLYSQPLTPDELYTLLTQHNVPNVVRM